MLRHTWIKAGGVFLIVFLLALSLGFMALFPSDMVRDGMAALDVPGEITVRTVRVDPLLRLNLRNVSWHLPENPLMRKVVLRQILIHPEWSQWLLGRKAFRATSRLGGTLVEAVLNQRKGRYFFSMATSGSIAFPLPFDLRPGINLKGWWQLKADIRFEAREQAGGVSGGGVLKASDLRFQWRTSPFGSIDLPFTMASIEGEIVRSVLNLDKIVFRGDMMDVDGAAVVWRDPITGNFQVKGKLYFRPKVGLGVRNPSLEAAIQLLPKDPKGFRFVF